MPNTGTSGAPEPARSCHLRPHALKASDGPKRTPRLGNDAGSITAQIRELTNGLGADCGAECIGYQCHNSAGKEVPNLVMNSLVDSDKATGIIGVIGVFVPQDPGAEDELARKGQIAFDFGKFWFKGQKMGPANAM